MSHRSSLGIILDEDEDEKLVEETTVMTPAVIMPIKAKKMKTFVRVFLKCMSNFNVCDASPIENRTC